MKSYRSLNMILLLYQITTTMQHLTTLSSVCIYHYSIFLWSSTPEPCDSLCVLYMLYVQICILCMCRCIELSTFSTVLVWLGNSSTEELEMFIKEKETEADNRGLDITDPLSTVSTVSNEVHKPYSVFYCLCPFRVWTKLCEEDVVLLISVVKIMCKVEWLPVSETQNNFLWNGL